MQPNMIGAYGPWAAAIVGEEPGRFSFRRAEWQDVEAWRPLARQRLMALLAQPEIGGLPQVTTHKQYAYDGLHVEELSWQLSYGPRTQAIFLKPAGAVDRLPGILALHDHGGNKYFGKRKLTRTAQQQHPVMVEHRAEYYGGAPWANEIAKRGYAVLVPDAFPFASRRVLLADVNEEIRQGLSDRDPEQVESILAYNEWAAAHESIMAKSLFCAGTT